jgi:anti-sigma regulatory factor (Ser/Thr protein kinase)
LSEERIGVVALAVSEAASNLVKHGGGGALVLQSLHHDDRCAVEFFALDRGCGIANLQASLRDGHSTSGTAGLGLGALSRLCSQFDIYTRPGAGTAVCGVIWSGEAPDADKELQSGGICVPIKGETLCGDDWNLSASKGRYVLLVVDGLGHGPQAAAAAAKAREVAALNVARSPKDQVEALHAGMRATRGAAVAIVELKPWAEVGSFCGLGNIACFTRIDGKARSLVSYNGIAGHQMGRIQEFSFPFPAGALLYAYSDGMTSRWNPEAYPGLENHHPSLIAAVLYRDHARGRDDTTLAALRNVRLTR